LIRDLTFSLTFFLLLSFPPSTWAYRILFYENDSDGISGVVQRCVPILRKAGNQVTVINMEGKNHDPAQDNWGPPYDQVWDMRFVKRDKTLCGTGRPQAADYFDEHWRSKAVHFLDHCGKLFIAGEYFTYVDRNEGLYSFLREVGAVKRGYDPCPPSSRGNSSTNGGAFYPVLHGLGPVSFYGDMVGGIPLDQLNGTSFVDTDEDWVDGPVDRSVVCGWTGKQLSGLTAPECNRGKLFMVWDATMWSDGWNKKGGDVDEGAPIWNDDAWQPGQIDTDRPKARRPSGAQEVTAKFFPAIARWLGNAACPCGSPVPEPPTVTPTPTAWVRPAKAAPALSPVPLAPLEEGPSTAQTILFSAPPVNIYMEFKDGTGQYRLDIYDAGGVHLKNPFNQAVTLEKNAWTAWDGTNSQGLMMSRGNYFAYLSKDGKFLRKIALNWTGP